MELCKNGIGETFMTNFDVLLEKELAVKAFDYPEEDGELERGSSSTERILNFGTARHPNTGNMLTYGLDLNTLTPEDASILMNPEYLEYAWKSNDPIQRRDRLIEIINRKEDKSLEPKDVGEEPSGTKGYRLVFKRGPAEYREKRRITTPEGEKLVPEPHMSSTSSWKSFMADKIKDREMILLDVNPFRKILDKLEDHDDEYTFKNLTDDYLRQASETGEAPEIEPEDIKYEDPEDYVDPDIVDTEPIKPSEIDKAKAKEIEEPEVDVKFEPDTDIDTGEVETEFEPEIEIEPKIEPEEPEVELEPDIEKAIEKRVRDEVENEIKDKIDEIEEPEEPEEEEPEPELEETAEIEESINKALLDAGLCL